MTMDYWGGEELTKQELYNKIKEYYFLDPIFGEDYLIFI